MNSIVRYGETQYVTRSGGLGAMFEEKLFEPTDIMVLLFKLRDAINGFFDITLPKIAQSLRGRINDNFQMIEQPATSGSIDI